MPLDKGKIEPEPEYKDNEPPQSEQSKWETEQMSSAVFNFGAKDKKGKKVIFELLEISLYL